MPNFLDRAAAMISRMAQASLSRPITYTRTGVGSLEFDATPGMGNQEFDLGEGFLLKWQGRDWYFPAALLDFGDGFSEPVKGDRIAETLGGFVHTFHVVQPADTVPCWDYVDAAQVQIVVRTKLISRVSA